MAGIVATSATTSNAGDTAEDKSVSGYLVNEQVTLTTDPEGSSYSWTVSVPSGSSRAGLTSSTAGAVKFTPDVEGYYVITCYVDGTMYIMRLSAVLVGTVNTVGPVRYQPLTNAQAPAPSSGRTLFYSSDAGAMATKDPDGNVSIFVGSGGQQSTVDFTPQDPFPAYQEGRVFYDGANHTFAIYNDQSDVTLQIGQELHVRVVNKTGSTIQNGKAVYINGAQGNRPTVALANASTIGWCDVVGISTHDIPDNQEGLVTVIGTVDGVDTSGFTDGAALWVSDAVAGDLTETKPTAPSVRVCVGNALNSTVNGRILAQIKADFS